MDEDTLTDWLMMIGNVHDCIKSGKMYDACYILCDLEKKIAMGGDELHSKEEMRKFNEGFAYRKKGKDGKMDQRSGQTP